MKYFLKMIFMVVLAIIVSGLLYLSADLIPIYKQFLTTMELITGHHLTFLDYFKSIIWIEALSYLCYLLKLIVVIVFSLE